MSPLATNAAAVLLETAKAAGPNVQPVYGRHRSWHHHDGGLRIISR
jgi:hypothetical protein